MFRISRLIFITFINVKKLLNDFYVLYLCIIFMHILTALESICKVVKIYIKIT